jgi:multidrug efflux pump subunit AcrA (membrane-fusion protein)
MVAELKVIDYKKADAIVVPINAIQQIDGQDIVFIAMKESDKLVAKKVMVKVGKQYNGLSEILSGLNEGDQIISVGFQDLTDGQIVKL